jgi:hypothetical protein
MVIDKLECAIVIKLVTLQTVFVRFHSMKMLEDYSFRQPRIKGTISYKSHHTCCLWQCALSYTLITLSATTLHSVFYQIFFTDLENKNSGIQRSRGNESGVYISIKLNKCVMISNMRIKLNKCVMISNMNIK